MPFDSATAAVLAQSLGISTGSATAIFNSGPAGTTSAVQLLGAVGVPGAKPCTPQAVPAYLSVQNIATTADLKHG